MPGGHTLVHTAEVDAPTTALKVPGAHAVQAEVPVVTALYAPAGQPAQPVVPVVAALYAPAGHEVHAPLDPAWALPL